MSRSGYSEDWDGDGVPPEFYRSAVRNAIKGRRGQAALAELAAALDAMPEKALGAYEIKDEAGCLCVMGVLGVARGIDPEKLAYEADDLARQVGLARAMVAELIYENDQDFSYRRQDETPEQRWERMRRIVAAWLHPKTPVY